MKGYTVEETRTCAWHGSYKATIKFPDDPFSSEASDCPACEGEKKGVLKRKDEPTQETRTCDEHCNYVSTIHPGLFAGCQPWATSCPGCESEREAERQRQEDARKEKERRNRISNNRMVANIPARFAGCTFDNYVASSSGQRNALSVAKGFAENFKAIREAGNSLTLCGNPGCGKTHLALAIGNHLLEAEKTVIYTTVIELIRAIRDTWRHESSRSETAVIKEFRKVDLLILDEVGVSFSSEAEKTQLFDVLDGRYREMRPTVIVSNLNGKGLQECLGPRIYDRLTQNGSGVVVFTWDSYRPKRPLTRNATAPVQPAPFESVSKRTRKMREEA